MHMRACGLEEGTARMAGVHCASQSAPATVATAEPQVALIRNSHVESSALLQESRLTPTQINSEVEEQEFCKMCETAYKRGCASGAESYIHAHRCLILVHGV